MTKSKPEQVQSEVSQEVSSENSISRRALLAGTAAFAVGASATLAKAGGQDGHDGHAHHHAGGGGNHALVRAAGDCQIAGEICQAHCQAMLATGDTSLAACSASVRDMMASCSSLMQLAASDSKHLPGMAKICSQILEDCKAECEKHADHEECKECAKACEGCLKECKKVMA
jgi:Cys-rich four helix bundle protein (predicted Tat secretion target)